MKTGSLILLNTIREKMSAMMAGIPTLGDSKRLLEKINSYLKKKKNQDEKPWEWPLWVKTSGYPLPLYPWFLPYRLNWAYLFANA